MPLSEVVFKVMHDCPFSNISRNFPSLKMFVWCNREHEIVEIVVEKPEEYLARAQRLNDLKLIRSIKNIKQDIDSALDEWIIYL